MRRGEMRSPPPPPLPPLLAMQRCTQLTQLQIHRCRCTALFLSSDDPVQEVVVARDPGPAVQLPLQPGLRHAPGWLGLMDWAGGCCHCHVRGLHPHSMLASSAAAHTARGVHQRLHSDSPLTTPAGLPVAVLAAVP